LEFSHGPERVRRHLENILHDGTSDGTIVAIGECGLDYDRLHYCPKDWQLVGFETQLEMATSFPHLPLFLHNRNTGGDFSRLIRQYRDRIGGGVVHSFTDSKEEMLELVDLDLYIGINGCSLKTEENLKMVEAVPIDKLLLETDAPWCSIKATHASFPHVTTKFPSVKKEKHRDGLMVKDRCEPCQMIQVLEVVAKVKQIDPLELAQRVAENTERLFPTMYN
jgi:TatD DNase family protein